MSVMAQNSARHRSRIRTILTVATTVVALLLWSDGGSARAAQQNTGLAPPSAETVQKAASAPPPETPPALAGAIQIDRVVAIVNGDLILESDVDEERRFAAFQPYSNLTGAFSRQDAINRLIDRTLILQQDDQQAMPPITDEEVTADILDLRKAIFACRPYHCETDAGWDRYLTDNGFTEKEFRQRWHDRMVTLRFTEQRFRMGIRITPAEINQYYQKTLLPEYASRHVPAPKVDVIRDRIQEILLQQQVGRLLDDWLQALRASGDVQMGTPGEVAP
jgi:peptidyl-prolyl cis-trans isomerase SurA